MRLVPCLCLAFLSAACGARTPLQVGQAPGVCAMEAWEDEVNAAPKTIAAIEQLARRFDVVAAASRDGACRVDLFRKYYGRYVDVQEDFTHLFRADRGAAELRRIEEELPRLGWRRVGDGSDVRIVDGSDWLIRGPGRHLPARWREYFTLDIAERSRPWSENGTILVDIAELRERLLRWEGFVARNPAFVARVPRPEPSVVYDLPEPYWIHDRCDEYLRALTTGTDRTPAFEPADDSVGDVMRPEFRTALEAYVADSRAGHRQWVRDYLAFLSARGFRGSDEAVAWLLDHDEPGR